MTTLESCLYGSNDYGNCTDMEPMDMDAVWNRLDGTLNHAYMKLTTIGTVRARDYKCLELCLPGLNGIGAICIGGLMALRL